MNALEAIFRAVLEVSWRSSWLILAVIALRTLLRGRLSARVVSWAWIVVSFRLLWPFSVSATWSPFNFAPFVHRSSPAIVPTTTAGIAAPVGMEITPVAGTTAPGASRLPPQGKLTAAQWLALVWGAGVIALLLARIWAYGRFVRALRRSSFVPNSTLATLLAEATGRSNPKRISITVTDVVRAPALHGILRPELLFPPGFIEKLTPCEFQLTVAHELAHHQRRDLAAQVLIHGVVILHWFNPLAWIAVHMAREDCELACDEFVLRHVPATERESYASTLLKILRLANRGTPPPLGLGVVESKQQIKRRIVMIMTQPSSPLACTALGCALFVLAAGLSLTAETRAQSGPIVSESRGAPAVPLRVLPEPDPSQWKFPYSPATDGLGVLFPSGVVAIIGDRTIMVEDVRREMEPLVSQLQRMSHDQEDFDLRINQLQNRVIRDLVGRILYIKKFHVPLADGNTKHIPESYVDNAISDRLKDQFDNDRSKFLAHLRDRGKTIRDYRHEIEEEIIYHYMVGQERKLNPDAKSKKAMAGGTEGQVHLRLIQLKRAANATDAALLEKANMILARLKSGESFEALAREFSEDRRRDRGGDWGWMSPTDLKPDYSEKAFALKKGEVSAPILTSEGGFLLYAEDRK